MNVKTVLYKQSGSPKVIFMELGVTIYKIWWLKWNLTDFFFLSIRILGVCRSIHKVKTQCEEFFTRKGQAMTLYRMHVEVQRHFCEGVIAV